MKSNLLFDRKLGIKVAEDFYRLILDKIDLVSENPNTRKLTGINSTRSILVGKGYQNRIFNRVEKNKVVFVNMIDTRRNPTSNPFNKAR